MLKVIKDYCSETNLHGFIYIVQPTRHKIERIFWSVSIFTSFILTGILISKFIIESQLNPIVIYTDQNVINVQDINFPAVSFCPGVILKIGDNVSLDYYEIKQKLENATIEINNLTLIELKMMQVASLVARDRFMSSNFPNLSIPTDDFMETLESFLPFMDEPVKNEVYVNIPYEFNANWTDQYPVDMVQNLWKTGICYTFNLPKPTEIFNNKSASPFFFNRKSTVLGSFLFAVFNHKLKLSYPVKAHTPGKGLFIGFTEKQQRTTPTSYILEHVVPVRNYNGLKVMFHDPYEMISNDAVVRHARKTSFSKFSIIPKITKMDESFMEIDLDDRLCYFQNERQLKFFKIYNKVNCEHECLVNRTLEACKCVQFFMVSGPESTICGVRDEVCFLTIENEFDLTKETCKCYDLCESVKYGVQVIYDWSRKFFYANIRKMVRDIEIKIEFGVKEFLATSKKKGHTLVDMLSLIGGFLGLFAGFSFLSAGEIILHFLIKPLWMMKQLKSTKVRPDTVNSLNQKSSNKMIEYLNEFLTNSTIHSFNHIGNKKKSLWSCLFFASMVMAFLTVRGLYQKLRSSEIVMSLEGMPTSVEDIQFPAFTIVADVNAEVDNYIEANYAVENSRKNINRWKRETFYDPKCEIYNDVYYHVYGILCELYSAQTRTRYCKNNYTSTSEFVEYLRNETDEERPWFIYRKAMWNGMIDPPFAYILTNYGFGYTFNLVKSNLLLNENVVSKDFHFSYDSDQNINFPWKTSVGTNKGLEINFKMNKLWDGCFDHDTFIIHPPNELPLNIEIVRLEDLAATDVFITPEIIKTDEDLASFDVDYRKCYFDDERKLKYFKIYTQKNCEQECLSEIIYSECGCVPFYSIRNSSTTVCDYRLYIGCGTRFDGFSKLKDYDHLYASHGFCHCYPLCNSVSYSYQIFTKSFNTNQNNSISLMWENNEYYALVRYQQFKVVDFLSYVGGILGLFAGISALSVVECFYFLTLRLITDLWRFYHSICDY